MFFLSSRNFNFWQVLNLNWITVQWGHRWRYAKWRHLKGGATEPEQLDRPSWAATAAWTEQGRRDDASDAFSIGARLRRLRFKTRARIATAPSLLPCPVQADAAAVRRQVAPPADKRHLLPSPLVLWSGDVRRPHSRSGDVPTFVRLGPGGPLGPRPSKHPKWTVRPTPKTVDQYEFCRALGVFFTTMSVARTRRQRRAKNFFTTLNRPSFGMVVPHSLRWRYEKADVCSVRSFMVVKLWNFSNRLVSYMTKS